MCGRFILVQKLEKLEARFNVTAIPELIFTPSFNISPGKTSLIISSDSPDKIQAAVFGLTPFWAKKPMFLFNARAEGDRNKENDPNFRGAKDIINKPSFRKPIRSQRCLVPADAFIEGTTTEGLSKPFLVFLKNKQRPFAFAGIYDDWKNPITNELIRSFSIITTTANSFMQKLPHHRSPVILEQWQEKKWISSKTALTDITDMLKPCNPDILNAYPISESIKNPKNDNADLIKPIGDTIEKETDFSIKNTLSNQGFGRNNRHF
ncbi:MAG TPA: SOS response-associated peptidase [Bacteroidales bacterium]|nr:SOS response-associated peptidase [Bacteroidales bacterium]